MLEFFMNDNTKEIVVGFNGLKEVAGFKKLEANTVEAAREKHIPVINIDCNKVSVIVGEVLHPSMENHFIQCIYLQTNKGGYMSEIGSAMEPKADFVLKEDEKVVAAYAYCNLHGLWAKEM